MSPDTAEAVRRESPCRYCGCDAGARCSNRRGEPTDRIHDKRVQDNLFRRTARAAS